MNIQAKLDLVNQQSYNRIMQDLYFRKANCFSCEPLNPGSEIQILAFNFLGITLAYLMLIGFKVTFISAPIIGVITANAKKAQAMLSAL